ncbi:uncharacterized protein RCC_11238 [Ramularia collo-cygni]|uniref:Zn(2)-C6 fungal-type domain-containing protein n=1 Tax=Ramularia collo-cygni TaxID=112498 RepID=A0A2D3VHH0_9PEZI|nr:uncharacterized protein RCC_11238 [Ramularia collo-cygni]CZT25505.1 uncharacterized protein RCC_11238 [Ramularia collo-cygni]
MPADRSARRGTAEKACNECQRRKTKCTLSEDGSHCGFCRRAGKACVFEEPPQRTPLTRQNLDQAEARCRQLELMLQQQRETAMPSDSSSAAEHQQTTLRANNPGEGIADYEWNEATDPEAREQSSDSDHARDGMGALTSRKSGSGYLGTSSGHELLQSVSSFLPPSTSAVRRSERAPHETPMSNSSAPGLPHLYSSSLSTAFIQEQLISAYFAKYNTSYPILHEKSFRDQCSTRKSLPRSSSWHITYYAVLAMGEWVSGSGTDDQPSLYYEAARSLLKPEVLESGSINGVQSFLILGNYLQKTDRPNTGYNYLGLALRLAMGLGLHRELPSTSPASPFKRHRRRIVFWVLYCFDSWFNITTGRPSLLSDANFDVQMPQNVEEEALDSSGRLIDVTGPTTCSLITALARLTKIANKVYNEVICAGSCADVDHLTVVMEHMIQNWQSALPAYMTSANVPAWFLGPRQTIHWKAANLRILLLLASQRHRTDEFEKLAVGSRCQEVAVSSISDIATFCDHHPDHLHSGLAWYAVYFTLQAMLSFTSQCVYRWRAGRQFDDVDTQHYENTASMAVNCIEALQAKNAAANRAYRIIHRLRDVVRQTSGIIPLDATLQAGMSSHGVSDGSNGLQVNNGMQHILGPQDPPTDPSSIPLDYDQAIPNLVLAEWGNAADLSLHSLFNGMDDFGAGDLYT